MTQEIEENINDLGVAKLIEKSGGTVLFSKEVMNKLLNVYVFE